MMDSIINGVLLVPFKINSLVMRTTNMRGPNILLYLENSFSRVIKHFDRYDHILTYPRKMSVKLKCKKQFKN